MMQRSANAFRTFVRRACVLALIIITAAVLNTLVAWSIAYRNQSGKRGTALAPTQVQDGDDISFWQNNRRDDWPAIPDRYEREMIAFGTCETRMYSSWQTNQTPPLLYALETRASGFPLQSLEWGEWRIWTQQGRTSSAERYRTHGFALPFIKPAVILPLKPIWFAFIGNTLAMSLLIWCVAALPFVLRKRFRRAQHQCLACGYDLRGTLHQAPRQDDASESKCPECGAILLKQKAETQKAEMQ